MRARQNLINPVVVVLLMIAAGTAATAQNWSDAQKAVWNDVATYWQAYADGNADGMLAYFHKDYKGWDKNDPLPGSRAQSEEGIKYFLSNNTIVRHQVNPAAIEVHGNFAFAHYYYNMTFKNAEGKNVNTRGRWTDILMKSDGKWMLIGDHGGNDQGN